MRLARVEPHQHPEDLGDRRLQGALENATGSAPSLATYQRGIPQTYFGCRGSLTELSQEKCPYQIQSAPWPQIFEINVGIAASDP